MRDKIRNLLAWSYSWLLYLRGDFKKIKRLSASGQIIHSVYFHNPSRMLFERSVKWFLRRGYTFLTTDSLHEILQSGRSFPPHSVIFTVDDGWKENVDNIVPVAEKYHVPVTIFITTDVVEHGGRYWWSAVEHAVGNSINITKLMHSLKAMNDKERREKVAMISQGIMDEREAMNVQQIMDISGSKYIHFGGHTTTHPILTRCDDATLLHELSVSKNKLSSWTNKPVLDFAYPNGSYDQREIEYLKSLGYRMAFTTQPGFITPMNRKNIYSIHRFDVLENVTYRENVCRMSGVWFLRKKKDKVNIWE